MTTAVDKWPASARLFGGRYGGPLTHRSYTTPWGTTFTIVLPSTGARKWKRRCTRIRRD